VPARIRPAKPSDVPALFAVRTAVRENYLSREQLAQLGVTEGSISRMIAASPCAWVVTNNDDVVGFSMVDIPDACLFAAFVLPVHEGQGFGRKLVLAAENVLFQHHVEIWLETDKNSRAAGFYRHLGWGNGHQAKGNQIRLTKTRP
jgi:ribosomal protein S18 acetylase RimI-like enzyme